MVRAAHWLDGGREQEALAEVNRAHQLDPLSSSPTIWSAISLLGRRYDDAIAVGQKVANENPHSPASTVVWPCVLGETHVPAGLSEWIIYGQLSGNRDEYAFDSAMSKDFIQRAGRALSPKASKTRWRNARRDIPLRAALLSSMPNWAQRSGLPVAQHSYQERDLWLLSLKTDFMLDPFRSDPRFAELVRKVGLP